MARPLARAKQTVLNPLLQRWADTVLGRFGVLYVPADQRLERSVYNKAETGDDVYLQIPLASDRQVSLELTKFTSTELDYMESVIAFAIEKARPIVAERDEVARKADEEGAEIIFERTYRQTPQLFSRTPPPRKELADESSDIHLPGPDSVHQAPPIPRPK